MLINNYPLSLGFFLPLARLDRNNVGYVTERASMCDCDGRHVSTSRQRPNSCPWAWHWGIFGMVLPLGGASCVRVVCLCSSRKTLSCSAYQPRAISLSYTSYALNWLCNFNQEQLIVRTIAFIRPKQWVNNALGNTARTIRRVCGSATWVGVSAICHGIRYAFQLIFSVVRIGCKLQGSPEVYIGMNNDGHDNNFNGRCGQAVGYLSPSL